MSESRVQVLSATGGLAVTNCYLIADATTGQAVLFDAPDHTVGPLLDELRRRGWTLTGLWLTHGHFDHLADHAEVRGRCPQAELRMHALDVPKLRRPDATIFRLPFVIPPGEPTALVEDGQTLRLGTLRVDVLHTPGHSPGHVCYHLPEVGLLVGGDLIIGGSIGRTDLPDSDIVQMQASIRRVMTLPPATRLLPGHGRPSTLGEEGETNAYVQAALDGALA